MTLIMAAAAIYGVLQMALLASPVRSLRLSTVLVTIAVGAYGSAVVAVLIEYAAARASVSRPGQSLPEALGSGAYTLVPVVEELAQIAPLLLAAWNLKIRSQLGMADFLVLGAATGAGLGLFETLLGHLLDAQKAFPLPGGGGWMLSAGLGGIGGGAPYIPDLPTVLSHWLPAQLGSLDFSYTQPSLGTNLHLAWGTIDAFGVALLVRAPGWRRLLGLLPIGYAISHHALVNYPGPNGGTVPDDAWQRTLLQAADDLIGWLPLICLALAMAVDYMAIRRGRHAMPAVLLDAEREGSTGLAALGAFALWRVPWTLLIALRFARLRRSLCYAAGRVHPERLRMLYAAAADSAARINTSNHEGAWDTARVRALLKSARSQSPWRRRWPLLLVPLILMAPSLLFLAFGSFTATKGLQEKFTTGQGPEILLYFGIAALAWTVLQLVLLIWAWRTTRHQPVGEQLALIRLRIWAATGATLSSGLLLFVHYRQGTPLDGHPSELPAMLLAFLDDLELYAGIALTILSLAALIMLFPPGGLALAGGGVLAGATTTEAAVQAGALGVAGIALMGQGAARGNGSGEDYNAWPRSKRKGRVRPQHRADIRGDEGRSLGGKSKAHTIDKHVDKTIDGMRQRLREDPELQSDSRYVDVDAAQRFTDETLSLAKNQRKISDWLARGAKGPLRLEATFEEHTGLHLTRYDFTHGLPTKWVNGVRVILKGDPSTSSGYRVLTSFPQP